MDLLGLRETRIFETLQALSGEEFVVVGGYAVNAYTLPRFSLDCDIVVKDENELKRAAKLLLGMGYSRVPGKKAPRGLWEELRKVCRGDSA